MFRFIKLDGLQHPSDETLLGYLDGEIGARRRRRVAAHLDACWACRVRRDRFEHTIDLVMDARSARDEIVAPPGRWHGFEERLAEERSTFDPLQNLFARWSFVPWLSQRYASLATAIFLVLAAWLYLGSSPVMSASEILRRAGRAQESRLLQVTGPVTYQKLALHRRSHEGQETNATVELWREAGGSHLRHSGADGLWQEIDSILQSNRLDAGAPLSPGSYAAWCATGKPRVTKVFLSEHEEAYSVEMQRELSAGADHVVRAALLVRASDWHPVQAILQVRMRGGLSEYRLSELAFDVRPLSSLGVSFFGETRSTLADRSSPRSPRLKPAALPGLERSAPQDPESLEMEARYALHRAHACLGEAVEIVRESSGDVVVRGLVQTSQRREELVSALLATPEVKIHIDTAEALTEKILANAHPALDFSSYPKPILPLQKRLEEYFADRGGREEVGNAIVDLSNRAVSQSQEILEQAWALRHLELAYSAERIRRLPPGARRLLEQMLREHADNLGKVVRECRTTLTPFFSSLLDLEAVAGTSPAKADPSISDLLASARDVEELTGELFAGMTKDKKPEQLVERLVGTIGLLESGTESLQAALAHGLPGAFSAGLR
jgi:hypothetical protein